MWLNTLSVEQRRALLGLAHDVVVSDGLLDPNEERMMDQLRAEMGLGDDIEVDYLALDGIEDVFSTRRARAVAMLNLLKLSYADGAFEIEEECFLRELARSFRVDDETFALMDNWVRRYLAMEREAESFM